MAVPLWGDESRHPTLKNEQYLSSDPRHLAPDTYSSKLPVVPWNPRAACRATHLIARLAL